MMDQPKLQSDDKVNEDIDKFFTDLNLLLKLMKKESFYETPDS